VNAFVVAGRALMLLGAAAALVTGVVHARSRDLAALASTQRYTCPMHPEVKSNTPGSCPICNMALVPIRELAPSAADVPGGQYATAAAELRTVTRQVRAPAWIGADGGGRALLYRDDLVGLAEGETARFYAEGSQNVPAEAHLAPAGASPVDPSTVYVPFRLGGPPGGGTDGSPGSGVGSLWVEARARSLLVVPESAVLHGAGGAYVIVSGADGELSRRAVEVGRILDAGHVGALAGRQEGATVILSGLSEGERVVAGNAFFVDAERRLHEARATAGEAMR
jgi:hypothetical protein